MRYTLVSVLTILLFTQFAQARQFGYDGRHGSDGASARSGHSPNDVSIIADGSRRAYDLRGGNASDSAQNGQRGEDASSCYQPTERYNVYGANGGVGGDGGNGAHGGNGADATIFYSSTSDLGVVSLLNSGGRGSSGAYGSEGGRACRCSVYNWRRRHCWYEDVCRNVRVCEKVKKCTTVNGKRKCHWVDECKTVRKCDRVKKCQDRHYSCRDGRDGRNGSGGAHGRSGSRGSVKLVKGLESLPAQNTSQAISVVNLASSEVTLKKHIWATKSDLPRLLAPGSDVGSVYQEYVRTAENSVSLDWAASRSIEEFRDVILDLTFSQNAGAGVNFRTEHLLKKTVSKQGLHTSIEIEDAYRLSEVNQLTTGFNGRKSGLKITITDKAALNLVLGNQVHLKLELGQLGGTKKLYNAIVPADKMIVTAGSIVIKAGEIARESGKMRKGRKIKYTLNVTRTFGDSSTTVKIGKGRTKIR